MAGAATTAFSDGSGGPGWVPRRIRRVGAGAAVVEYQQGMADDDGFPQIAGVAITASAVPGKRTVPRAEVWAVATAARAADDPSALRQVCSDASYVVNGICATEQKRRRLRAAQNGDVWRALFGEAPTGPDCCRKVKGHLTYQQVLDGAATYEAYVGNHVADAAAGAEAAAAQFPGFVMEDIERWEAVAYCVARRLSAVEFALWKAQPQQVPAPPPPPEPSKLSVDQAAQALTKAVEDGGHVSAGGWVKCVCCQARRRFCCYSFWAFTRCGETRGLERQREGTRKRRFAALGVQLQPSPGRGRGAGAAYGVALPLLGPEEGLPPGCEGRGGSDHGGG
ncbi:MAG: hypothetical protein GY717_15885 [Rhodobacteraceae bacterium]|nr:hypothetical protein [Paracoccaceae bacterium]